MLPHAPRLILLILFCSAFAGCASQRYRTLEERREDKARWERFTEEEDDPY